MPEEKNVKFFEEIQKELEKNNIHLFRNSEVEERRKKGEPLVDMEVHYKNDEMEEVTYNRGTIVVDPENDSFRLPGLVYNPKQKKKIRDILKKRCIYEEPKIPWF